jgi:hypothetical protein
MKKINLLLILLILSSSLLSIKKPVDERKFKRGYIPKEGFVPNDKTAIKIAEAVWFAICGDQIYTKKPFVAKLENGIWYIEGSLPKGYKGGVPYIEINKRDGKILKVIFEK